MADILKNIQSNFVPSAEVSNQNEVLQRVFLDGDQLTEERARNAQLANTLADTTYERLGGLETAFADWHLGKNLLEVCSLFVFCIFGIYRSLVIRLSHFHISFVSSYFSSSLSKKTLQLKWEPAMLQ